MPRMCWLLLLLLLLQQPWLAAPLPSETTTGPLLLALIASDSQRQRMAHRAALLRSPAPCFRHLYFVSHSLFE